MTRGTQAHTGIMAAFGLAATVIVLLSWWLLGQAPDARDIPRPNDRLVALFGLAVLVLLVPVLWTVLRQSQARQRAESRLQEIADSLPGAVYRYRLTPEGVGSYEFLSINAGKVRGVHRETLLRDAHAARDVVLDEDRLLFDAAITRSAQELTDLDAHFRIRRQDGVVRWLHASAVPQRQASGDVVWHGYWADITEIKGTEQALREATRRLEDAQSVARLGDWTYDLQSGALSWSRQVYAILQRDPALPPPSLEEGMALIDDGAAGTADAFRKAQESGEAQAYEATARLSTGGSVPLHVIVLPIRDNAGAVVGMRGTIQDITERRALEERLSRAKEAADSANRAKSVFLASMSHEIRTPMNGILGILELISLTPLNPDLRSALDVVRDSGKSLQRIIDDILDFSKVEAGKLEVRPEPTSLHEVVADIHRIYSESASRLGLELRHVIDPAISPIVMVDGLRLRQILGNFVSNAIKFTSHGYVELRLDLVERDGPRERLRFVVEDTGIGIPAEVQERLFNPFEQAETSLASQVGGTGLGLSISKRLAELMGGEVSMSSEVGRGTTMSLDLTVVAAAPQPVSGKLHNIAAPQQATSPVVPSAGQAAADGNLVLVVDDHPTNRMVMRRQLNSLGYAAEEVEGGAEALESWNSGRFALVLTDCHMPGMSGYDLSRRIREAEAARGGGRTPIIACSANALAGVVQDCLDAGMDDYISKPIELKVLADKVKLWMPPATPGRESAPDEAAAAEVLNHPASIGAAEHKRQDALQAAQGSGPAVTPKVVEHFRRVNAVDVEQLMAAVEHGDMQSVAHLAHRIKGACGFIGATAMASVCGMVEQAGRAGDGPAIAWLMDVFRTELERLDAYLDAL